MKAENGFRELLQAKKKTQEKLEAEKNALILYIV